MKKTITLTIAKDQDYAIVKVGHLQLSAERIENDEWGILLEIKNTLTNTLIVSQEYDSDGYIEYAIGRNIYCIDIIMEKLPQYRANNVL